MLFRSELKYFIWGRDFISDKSNGVKLSDNLIIFKKQHLFDNGEHVIYAPEDQKGIVGLTTDAKYFARTIDAYTISLHLSKIDAIDNVNPISISDYGVGVQKFKTANKKKIVSSIEVANPGIGLTVATGENLLMNLEVGAAKTAVGIGSTFFQIDTFQTVRHGHSFKIGDKFRPVGLVHDKRLQKPLDQFELEVIEIFRDYFSAWQFGEIDFIDKIGRAHV